MNQRLEIDKKELIASFGINIILIVSHGLWNLIFLKAYRIGLLLSSIYKWGSKPLKMLPRIIQLAKRQTPYMNMSCSWMIACFFKKCSITDSNVLFLMAEKLSVIIYSSLGLPLGWQDTHMTFSCGLWEPSSRHLSVKIWFSVKDKSDRYVSSFLKLMKEVTNLKAQYFSK